MSLRTVAKRGVTERLREQHFHTYDDDPSWARTSHPKYRVWKRHVSRLRRNVRWGYVHARGCVVCGRRESPVRMPRQPTRYVRLLIRAEHLARLIRGDDPGISSDLRDIAMQWAGEARHR